jgi:hypothetical protein
MPLAVDKGGFVHDENESNRQNAFQLLRMADDFNKYVKDLEPVQIHLLDSITQLITHDSWNDNLTDLGRLALKQLRDHCYEGFIVCFAYLAAASPQLDGNALREIEPVLGSLLEALNTKPELTVATTTSKITTRSMKGKIPMLEPIPKLLRALLDAPKAERSRVLSILERVYYHDSSDTLPKRLQSFVTSIQVQSQTRSEDNTALFSGESTPALDDVLERVLRLAGDNGEKNFARGRQYDTIIEEISKNLTLVERNFQSVQSTHDVAAGECQKLRADLETALNQLAQREAQVLFVNGEASEKLSASEKECEALTEENLSLKKSIEELKDLNTKLQKQASQTEPGKAIVESTSSVNAGTLDQVVPTPPVVSDADTGGTDSALSGIGVGLRALLTPGSNAKKRKRTGEPETESGYTAASVTDGERARIAVLAYLMRGDHDGQDIARLLHQGGLECKRTKQMLIVLRPGWSESFAMHPDMETVDTTDQFESQEPLYNLLLDFQSRASKQDAVVTQLQRDLNNKKDELERVAKKSSEDLSQLMVEHQQRVEQLQVQQRDPEAPDKAVITLLRSIQSLLTAEPRAAKQWEDICVKFCKRSTVCGEHPCLFGPMHEYIDASVLASTDFGDDATSAGLFMRVISSISKVKQSQRQHTEVLSVMTHFLQISIDGGSHEREKLAGLLKNAGLECQRMVPVLRELQIHNNNPVAGLPISTDQYILCSSMFHQLFLLVSRFKQLQKTNDEHKEENRKTMLQVQELATDLLAKKSSLEEMAATHDEEIQKLRGERLGLKKQIADMETHSMQLTSSVDGEVTQWRSKNEEIAGQNRHLKDKVRESQKLTDELDAEVARQKKNVREEKEKRECTETELEDCRRRSAEVEDELCSLKRMIEEQGRRVRGHDALTEELSEVKRKLSNINGEKHAAEREAHKFKQEIQVLQGEYQQSEEALETLKKESEVFRKTVKELESKNRMSEDGMNAAERRCRGLEEEKEVLEAEVQRQKEAVKGIKDETNRMEKCLAESQGRAKGLAEEKDKEARRQEDVIIKLQEQITFLQKKLSSEEERASNLEQDRHALQGEARRLENELKQSCFDAHERSEKLARETGILKRKIQELEETTVQQNSHIQTLEEQKVEPMETPVGIMRPQEKAELEDKIASLEMEIQRLESRTEEVDKENTEVNSQIATMRVALESASKSRRENVELERNAIQLAEYISESKTQKRRLQRANSRVEELEQQIREHDDAVTCARAPVFCHHKLSRLQNVLVDFEAIQLHFNSKREELRKICTELVETQVPDSVKPLGMAPQYGKVKIFDHEWHIIGIKEAGLDLCLGLVRLGIRHDIKLSKLLYLHDTGLASSLRQCRDLKLHGYAYRLEIKGIYRTGNTYRIMYSDGNYTYISWRQLLEHGHAWYKYRGSVERRSTLKEELAAEFERRYKEDFESFQNSF